MRDAAYWHNMRCLATGFAIWLVASLLDLWLIWMHG